VRRRNGRGQLVSPNWSARRPENRFRRCGRARHTARKDALKNAEGVGEMSEAGARPAEPPPAVRHGMSPPSLLDPASGRTRECSSLGLANALSFRSGPSHTSRDREAITGMMEPDQSMKSSTRSRRLLGNDLALRFTLRLRLLCLLCLLRHAALLAEWLATSMKCTIRSCTSLHVLQRKEKNTLSP